MILKNLIFVGGGSWWTCMQYSYYHITFQLRFTFYNILQCNLLYDCFLSPFHPVFDGRQWDARTGMNTALGGRKGAFSAWHGLPPNVAISPENYLSIFMKIPGLNHNTRCWIDFGMIICIFICIYIYTVYSSTSYLLVIYWLSSFWFPKKTDRLQLDTWRLPHLGLFHTSEWLWTNVLTSLVHQKGWTVVKLWNKWSKRNQYLMMDEIRLTTWAG